MGDPHATRPRRRLAFHWSHIPIALGIWGLVIHLTTPSPFSSRGWHSKARAAEIQMDNLAAAIDMYKMDNQKLPDSLEALAQTSETVPEPYLEDVGPDPWGNAYEYRKDGAGYALRSSGADGALSTEDDIVLPRATPK